MTTSRRLVALVSPDRGIEGDWDESATGPDGCTVLFTGWLHDRTQLAGTLEIPAPRQVTNAELVLHAYTRWEQATFARLRGVFGLVLWDARRRAVYVVRDQVGAHPLFRADGRGVRLVSPSIDALLADPRVSREPDRPALVGFVAQCMPYQEETPYRFVRRIPQGHVWELTEQGSRTFRYWDPAPDSRAVEWAEPEELAGFERLFEQAVRRCLGLGRAGIYLSGGIDSVTVAAFASRLSDNEAGTAPIALSLAFPGDESEVAIQQSVAKQLAVRQVMLPVEDAAPDGLIRSALATAAEWPLPPVSPWVPAYLALNRAAADVGCETILTGGGGDEWLTVSPMWMADLVKSGRFVELVRFASTLRRSYALRPRQVLGNVWRFGFRRVLLDAVSSRSRSAAAYRVRRRLGAIPSWVAPDPELHQELRDRLRSSLPERPNGSAYFAEIRRVLEHPVADMYMEELYESCRRFGLQPALPFWDTDLITLLYRVPPPRLSSEGRSKGLVRELLDRRFPDAGFGRQRKAVAAGFFNNLFRREARWIMNDFGPVRALATLGVVDLPSLEKSFHDALDPARGLRPEWLWDMLCAEAWARTHL